MVLGGGASGIPGAENWNASYFLKKRREARRCVTIRLMRESTIHKHMDKHSTGLKEHYTLWIILSNIPYGVPIHREAINLPLTAAIPIS